MFLDSCTDKPHGMYTQCDITQPQKGVPVRRCSVGGSQGHYAKQNKPITKGKILYDSTRLELLQESPSWKQKTGKADGGQQVQWVLWFSFAR